MKNLLKCLLVGLLPVLVPVSLQAQTKACPLVKMEAERLPDLNTARAGHQTFCVMGELTVVGGHTNGFVLTPTAEYLRDGEWHQLQTTYTHDDGLAVVLDDDSVLLCGGHEKNLGIGQSFEVEMYYPRHHTVEGFGCLEQKRALFEGIRIDSNRVVIAGNWYGPDAIELYDMKTRRFSPLKESTQQRGYPFILRTSKTNALLFSTLDTKGHRLDTVKVDQLEGESFRVPLLSKWHIETMPHRSDDGFVGNEQQGDYRYLLAGLNDNGQLGIILVRNTTFSLLPTASPIPMKGIEGDSITYYHSVIADRKAQRGYVVGNGTTGRYYVLSIDCRLSPAPVVLYYTDPLGDVSISGNNAVLMPNGNLFVCGGIRDNNYAPLSSAFILHVGTPLTEAATPVWLWMLLGAGAIFVLASATYAFVRRRRKRTAIPAANTNGNAGQALMQRLNEVMQNEKLFLDSNLRLEDVAKAMGVSRTAVSNCINSLYGGQFKQFVNKHRIDYAQRLMLEQPDLKMISVWTQSGFASESAFFRAFKTVTGLAPIEWKRQQQET